MKKRWVIGKRDLVLEKHLSDALNIPPLIARILINRGIQDITSGREFLDISPDGLIDPFLLNDMERGVARLLKAVYDRERILIYGDYDVDGITASALYMEFFRSRGVDAGLYIPDRMSEGYSLNEGAVKMARSSDINIILTADCGTSSTGPVKLAQSLGIDVIITDHHEPPEALPEAYALINPNRRDSTYPFKGLTGVGVAFKLVQAISMALGDAGAGCRVSSNSGDTILNSKRYSRELSMVSPELTPTEARSNLASDFLPLTSGEDLFSYLDLVALGTIADVAPLTGENRFFVKHGLKRLTEEKRVGVRALKEAAGIGRGEVTAGTVSFVLAPRLNASGRLSRADVAARMLTTRNYEEARSAAGFLEKTNQERQRIENRIRDEVRAMVLREIDIENEKLIILASRQWHQGVIGIVASKIVDEFYRPCILIALQDDGNGKGSARSIPGFNIYKGLEACSDLLDRFGGHKYAAGLTVKESSIPLLRGRLSAVITEQMQDEDLTPRIVMDAEIDLEDINFPLLKEMMLLPPYGISNPEPVIVTKGLRITEPRVVGRDHLKAKIRRGGVCLDGIGFGMGSAYNDIIKEGRLIDAAYTPELNLWNGTYGIQLKLKDMKPSEDHGET